MVKFERIDNRFLDIGLRVIIGAVLITAAISKLPMQEEWVENVMAYKMLPPSLATLYAYAVPWVELVTGSCLIIGLFTKFFGWLATLLIVTFVAANANVLSTDPTGMCHCFGELLASRLDHKLALVIDVALLAGCILILLQRKHYMALDSRVAQFLPRLKRKR